MICFIIMLVLMAVVVVIYYEIKQKELKKFIKHNPDYIVIKSTPKWIRKIKF